MRRSLVILVAVLACALPLTAPAAAGPFPQPLAGACVTKMEAAYSPAISGAVPQDGSVGLGVVSSCLTSATPWVFNGSSSLARYACYSEVGLAQLNGSGPTGWAQATISWSRVGAYGWLTMFILAADQSAYHLHGVMIGASGTVLCPLGESWPAISYTSVGVLAGA